MQRPLNERDSSGDARATRVRTYPRPRGLARLVLAAAAGLFAAMSASVPVIAEEVARPSGAVVAGLGVAGTRPGPAERARTPRITGFSLFRGDAGGTRSAGSDGWWSMTACAALLFAAVGVLAVAARRRGPRTTAAAVQVVGRVSLSPKHAVCLLRVGRRVLVVGVGPQGPPALITELDDVPQDPPAHLPETIS